MKNTKRSFNCAAFPLTAVLLTPLIALVITLLSACAAKRENTGQIKKYQNGSGKIIITGQVFDAENNQRTLPGVAIKDTDTLLLTKTDKKGIYHIEPKPGKLILRTSYIGYRQSSSRLLTLVPGDSVVLNFRIRESHEHTSN